MIDLAWVLGSFAILWFFALDVINRGLKRPDQRAVLSVMVLESAWLAVITKLS